MTAEQNEMLSALVDGQLDGQELERAIELLSNNEQAKKNFLRYQFASDVMHGYTAGRQSIDLTQRLSTALAEEPAHQQTTTAPKAKVIRFPDWFGKQPARLALAASVGALAVVGIMNQSSNAPLPTTPVAAVQLPAAQTQVADNSNRWTVGEPEVEDRLNTYLVDHNEYAGASGLFSYARVVSYGKGQ